MLRIAIAGALVALGAVFWPGDRVEAASAECRVYATAPSWVPGTLQTLPCNEDGELITAGGGGGGGDVNIEEVGGVAVPTAGADNASNSVAGVPTYARVSIFDGSTWDRWTGTVVSTVADGADVALGALADAACATDNGTCSLIALVKRTNQRLTSLIASLGGTGTIGSAVPATATYTGVATDGGLAAGTPALAGLINCQSQAVVSEATSGNNEIVALTASERIYVCGYMLVGAGAVDVQWVYGTGSDCGTSETDLTGLMTIAAAGGGMADASPFWRGLAPATGNALCLELSGNVQVSGWVSYTKF
jgi:hypothetical protein